MDEDLLVEEKEPSHLQVLKSLLERIETHLMTSDLKATFSEYLRMLQFLQESGGEQPPVLKVQWIGPGESGII